MNRNRTPFVMYLPFSKKQMDQLAKDLGIKWTYPSAQTIPKEKIEVRPLLPPTGKLYYFEVKYE
jgi:hypothetical protein